MNLRAALLGAVLAACSVPAASSNGSAAPSTAAAPSASSATSVTVTESAYGRVVAKTAPGLRCGIEVHVAAPRYGDVPLAALDATADANGVVTLTYPTATLPKQTGRHVVACGGGTAAADFAVPGYPIPAAHFTARIRVAALTDQIDGVTARPDPSLVAARDRDVEALTRTLVSEWSTATRGLSTIELVGAAPADIVMTVISARATPNLTFSPADGSMTIFLFPADESGPFSADNFVAVALHELGHIWCCTGPDASADGHWAQPSADPLLQGVDRFGLMNHPVSCTVFAAGIESCPNRFSERELRTMGFTQIPAPPRSACIDSKNAFLVQLASLKDQIAGAKAAIDSTDALLASLEQQIRAIEAKYPGGIPPDVYAQYTALIDRYNATVLVRRTQVAAYNALVDRSNGIISQVNALLC